MAYHVLKEKECAGLLNKIKRPENQQKTIKVYDDRIISMVEKKQIHNVKKICKEITLYNPLWTKK